MLIGFGWGFKEFLDQAEGPDGFWCNTDCDSAFGKVSFVTLNCAAYAGCAHKEGRGGGAVAGGQS